MAQKEFSTCRSVDFDQDTALFRKFGNPFKVPCEDDEFTSSSIYWHSRQCKIFKSELKRQEFPSIPGIQA